MRFHVPDFHPVQDKQGRWKAAEEVEGTSKAESDSR